MDIDKSEPDFDYGVVDGRSPGELVKEISADISSLIRKEVELARLEIREIVRDAIRAVGLSGFALVLAMLLLPLLALTSIEVLAVWLPRWAATVIVTGTVGSLAVVGFLAARRIFKKRGSNFAPERTIQSIKEDVEWAKNLKKR